MKCYVALEITCGEVTNATTIEVSYIIVDALLRYNIILGRPFMNVLGAVISTMYLVVKYPQIGRRVRTIQEDQ